MVQVGRVLVRVLAPLVAMAMGVLPAHRGLVDVVVVAVVVAMGVPGLERLVEVRVRVPLAGVQPDAECERRAPADRERARRAVPEEPRERRPEERPDGEERPGARGADAAL